MKWFAKQEQIYNGQWKKEILYKNILKWELQQELSFDDFSDCDSGYCGI